MATGWGAAGEVGPLTWTASRPRPTRPGASALPHGLRDDRVHHFERGVRRAGQLVHFRRVPALVHQYRLGRVDGILAVLDGRTVAHHLRGADALLLVPAAARHRLHPARLRHQDGAARRHAAALAGRQGRPGHLLARVPRVRLQGRRRLPNRRHHRELFQEFADLPAPPDAHRVVGLPRAGLAAAFLRVTQAGHPARVQCARGRRAAEGRAPAQGGGQEGPLESG